MYTMRLSPATIRPTTSSSGSFPVRKSALINKGRRGGGAFSVQMSHPAAGSYALALSKLTDTGGNFEATLSDLEKLEQIFSDKETVNFFVDPLIPEDEKLDVIEEITKSAELQAQTGNFLAILMENNRMDIIPDIVEEYELYYNVKTDTQVALVSSVVRPESEDMAQIAKVVQQITGAKNVRIKSEIDESLIAGFTLQYGKDASNFIDMSARGKLEEIASIGDITLDELV